MHLEKLGGSDWLKTSAFSCNTYAKLQHECKVVTLVHALKILSVSTFCEIFSCASLTSTSMISLAIWCD